MLGRTHSRFHPLIHAGPVRIRFIGRALVATLVIAAASGPLQGAAQRLTAGGERTRPSHVSLSVNGGLGLPQSVSPETLGAGDAAVSGSSTNWDRNPGDVDFVEFSIQVAAGIGHRVEVFARFSPWYRNTSVHQEPVRFPVPPLDLFVDTYPTAALREGPLFMFAPEVPYKTYNLGNSTAIGAHARSSGDTVVGIKVNLTAEDRGDPAGIAVRGFVEIPTETPRYNVGFPEWRKLTGVSGKIDVGAELLVSRRWRDLEFIGNVGYKWTGNPERGLRTQFVDSSQTDPEAFLVGEPVETGLDLSNEVRLSVGLTLPLFAIGTDDWWWLFSEFSYRRFVGPSVELERLVHPAEISVGIQTIVPWFDHVAIGGGWQLLLNDAGRGDTRTTSLQTPDGRGDIHFGSLVDPALSSDVEAFLTARGATFTDGSSRVFSTDNPAFDAWRNVPVEPAEIHAEGNGNFMAFVTWTIDGPF